MEWAQACERLRSPMFAPLQPLLGRLPADRWPSLAELDALAGGVRNADGRQIRFVPAPQPGDPPTAPYELRIGASGEVPTRPDNWHDVFNALAWLTWPRAKARINAQHAAILGERGDEEARQRSPERDALTLFDEGGVVVAASDPSLLRLIADFRWKELFWTRREDAMAGMSCFVFGHGCWEQALEPYIGMVAKTVFVPVDALFHMLPIEVQLPRVDEALARHFESRARFTSPKAMAPMPILGVPGWYPGQDEAFYDNAAYFRSRRR